MSRILIVDDEANLRRMVAGLLQAEGYATSAAADADEALLSMQDGEPDAVLLDLALPRTDGLTLLETLRARWPAVPVVMMSGRATLADAVRATRTGAFHFLEKPLQPEALLLALEGALELRRARELTRALRAELSPGGDVLVGSSPAMQRVRELIQQIAPTDARVLITGESGTGKELAASAIHAASARASGPFIRVNCAAIPRELLESEMFGHERGAFTGAGESRKGRFELAHRGTLLLDEVADLGWEAQAKLLRVLESGTIERLGGERPIQVDVRVIAATNRNLAETLKAGRFRADLFYRLNVLNIHLPALRERTQDVPELVAHFMTRLHARDGLVSPVLEGSALARMREYSWPGNVRELANLCERLAILRAGTTVRAKDLEALLAERRSADDDDPSLGLVDRLDAFERRVIVRSLDDAGGSITEAAKRLQTDRPNLYRRMRRLGIEQ
jgi:two-component system nitrogen regulation response regulator NtrX